MLTRRELLEILALGAGTCIVGCGSLPEARLQASGDLPGSSLDINPIDRTLSEGASPRFFGDEPERIHPYLWDESVLNSQSSGPAEQVEIAIVGGGISGLITAYQLRDLNPVVLEASSRLGGNSKAQSWRGIDYPLGAAYLAQPDAGSDIARLFAELELNGKFRERPKDDYVLRKGGLQKGFWTDYKRLRDYLVSVLESPGKYPSIPTYDSGERKTIEALDQKDLLSHLTDVWGKALPFPLLSYIERYCQTSFGARPNEISAAAGLNFLASEFGPMIVFPGGNAAIAERLYLKLSAVLPANRLRTRAVTVKVQKKGDLFETLYHRADGPAARIHSRAVVMACPKFVARRICSGLAPERVEQMGKIEYRSYLVANVLLDAAVPFSFYDVIWLDEQQEGTDRMSDFILADYAGFSETEPGSVLSCFWAFPYAGVRSELLQSEAFGRYSEKCRTEVVNHILPALKLSSKNVREVRLALWGHPLPIAFPGVYRSGLAYKLGQPQENLYFIQQDNWLLPSFECAAEEAFHWSSHIRKALM